MKFLFITPTHVTYRINGADWYDQLLAEELTKRGHECVFLAQLSRLTEYNGIKIEPYSAAGRLFKWADVITCRPQHFLRLPLKGKNVFVVQHNLQYEPRLPKSVKVVYVANHLKEYINYPNPSFVLHPINRYKDSEPIKGGNKVALVNCNKNKGGSELIKLAKMLPNMQFVGVQGYGTQIKENLPNIEYRLPDLDLRNVLHDCEAVVSFSKSEGYPMLVMEAQSLGLPFLGSKIPGHFEVGCTGYFDDLYSLKDILINHLHLPLNNDRPNADIEGFLNFVQSQAG